jgi:NADH-quinone oxidoreductase subunit G
MDKTVTLQIDNQSVTVPAGSLIVDAAKMAGIDIPVFCYHPKMEPVGMCRMCLVSIGRPARDRATNELMLDDLGSPKIVFGPKLETACTTPVSEGMVVVTSSEIVDAAHKEVLEFLLTSHPLDCPICDKGGECPLQNLTMAHGPGQSRFLLDEKINLAKHYPLGELIVLDRERCIQCGRCVRFQDEIAGDPVIGFSQRGRALEIVTFSEPGFDSYFSGNTTDICPVGALTTTDFRFKARPWEMKPAASICNHCPVGCNITFNVRREVASGGGFSIKRVMPRQNEQVNEIWMCDKGRFVYQYMEDDRRLTQPLVRRGEDLVETTWEEALSLAAEKIGSAGAGMVTLAGGRLSNEDLFNLQQVTASQGGQAILDTYMAGGDLVSQVGVGQGTNFTEMGPGAAILVAACDLHDEAPVWYLQVKQAAERGATVIVVNPRFTKLERYAQHVVRYEYGNENEALSSLLPTRSGSADEALRQAAEAFETAANAVVLFGSEGIGLAESQRLSRTCAELLVQTGHIGRPNNGLIGVWPAGNVQGAWDMGFTPAERCGEMLASASVAYIAAADPVGDDHGLVEALGRAGFVIVQDLFLTESAKAADLVLPVQAYAEREGTFTNGLRRVQRYYPALPPVEGPLPDFGIAGQIGQRLGLSLEGKHAALVLRQIAEHIPDYQGLTYQKLAEVEDQWPIIGREDLYYGGTGYDNHQGLGKQLSSAAQRGEPLNLPARSRAEAVEQTAAADTLRIVPITRLYDRSNVMLPTTLLHQRMETAELKLHPETAAAYGLRAGDRVEIELGKQSARVGVAVDEDLPQGVALMPRDVGLPWPLVGSKTVRLSRQEGLGASSL